MNNIDARRDAKLLANKNQYDERRREKAIARRQQDTLRRITPGVATPASAMPKRRG